MPSPSPSPLARDIAAALDWWRTAGVDASFSDEPRGWLGTPAGTADTPGPDPATPVQIPTAPPPGIGGPREHWPQTLPEFSQWWLNEPSLDTGGLTPRVAPAGQANADVMVLVAMPEEDDRERLLSGPAGALLDGFLAAAGIAPERVYRASVLPRFTALPDWAGIAAEGMGAVIAHHVGLVEPQHLLVLGRTILPLCGHDPAQGPAALAFFNHDGGRVPALAEVGLERLLGNAQLRARLWRRWLEFTDG